MTRHIRAFVVVTVLVLCCSYLTSRALAADATIPSLENDTLVLNQPEFSIGANDVVQQQQVSNIKKDITTAKQAGRATTWLHLRLWLVTYRHPIDSVLLLALLYLIIRNARRRVQEPNITPTSSYQPPQAPTSTHPNSQPPVFHG